MKQLFTCISDVHLKLSTIDVSMLVLRQSLNTSRELGIPLLINGDLNDTKALLRSECVRAILNLFREYEDIPVFINVGNHDLENKNSDNNSLMFLNTLPNVSVIEKETIVKFGGVDFGVIPYKRTNNEFLDAADLFRQGGIKNLLTHQGYMSAFMGDYVVDESSVNPQLVADFDKIISGHYHKAQNVGSNITYTGSPYTVNFGEAGQDKFYWVIGWEDEKVVMQSIQTTARRHEVLEFNNKIPRTVPKYPENTILKVVLKGSKEFCARTKREKIQKKVGLESVVIATDITEQSQVRLDTKDIHSPEKVIETYLASCDTEFNKEELMNLLRMVAKESFESLVAANKRNFKIVSIKCKNFLSFKDLEFEYENNGLTLINGWDEDREIFTGAGKSTFMDAPYYALFGKTSKNLKADEVVNRSAKKDCSVTVKLDSEEGVYTINRYRKHSEWNNDLFIIGPDGNEIRGKDNLETQKYINALLGVTPEIFLNATYFTQFNVIDKFLSSSDTEKKKLIAEISNTQIYDDIENDVKEKIKEIKTSLDEVNLLHAKSESRFEESKVNYDRYNKSKSDEDSRILSVQESYKLKLDGFSEEKELQVKLLQTASDTYIQNRAATLDKYKRLIKEDKKAYDKKLDASASQVGTLKVKNEELMAEISKIQNTKHKDYSIDISRIDSKLEAIGKLKEMKYKKDAESSAKARQIKEINLQVQSEESKLESSGSECSVCHQPINADTIKAIIVDKKNEILSIENAIKVLQSDSEKIKLAVSAEQSLISERSDLIESSSKASLGAGAIANLQGQIDNNNVIIERLSNPEQFYSQYESKLERLEEEVNPYESEIAAAKNRENPYLSSYEESLKLINPFISHIEEAKRDLDLYESEIEVLLSRVEDFTLLLDKMIFWKDALKTYIKSYLIDSFIEQINTIANEHLDSVSGGLLKVNISSTTAQGKKIKEKIDVTILNGNDSCSYESLSGGERTRICLALNLALSDVITNTSGKSFRILMLDEVFNGLDEVGKSSVMMLFKGLEVNYDTIFVIDHATEFKNLFNNAILIEKKNDISKLAI